MTSTYIDFNPNNFFYADALSVNAPFSPTNDNCTNLNSKVFLCDHAHFKDTSFNCLGQQMCKNKKLVNSIEDDKKNDLYVDKEKNSDDNISYDNSLLKTINLGIGIGVLVYLTMSDS